MGTMRIEYVNDNGEEIEAEIPCCKEVCPRCQGEGKHVNPAIDGHGITSEEWSDWDDESRENYFSGVYDVTCEECQGLRVIDIPDVDRFSETDKVHWAHYEEKLNDLAELRRIEEAERRFGA